MISPHLHPLPQGEEAVFAASEGFKRLFASLSTYHDVDSRSAALNMAIDEALLEIVTEPTIRFYRWDHPALSFGYFGKFSDVADYVASYDLVRRWTGGGIVFHGDDLTYSLVIPAKAEAFAESATSIYEKVHEAIKAALGSQAELATAAALDECRGKIASTIIDHRYSECFANPVRADVLVDGRKVAGAAQRRTRRGLLQQGSIQQADLADDFADRFAGELSIKYVCKRLDPTLIARAEQIAQEKYATTAWLRRR